MELFTKIEESGSYFSRWQSANLMATISQYVAINTDCVVAGKALYAHVEDQDFGQAVFTRGTQPNAEPCTK